MMMINNIIFVFNNLLPTTAPEIGIVEVTPQHAFSMAWVKNS
jgi:hypothetical protein